MLAEPCEAVRAKPKGEPNTEPWGTPASISCREKMTLHTLKAAGTAVCLTYKQKHNQAGNAVGFVVTSSGPSGAGGAGDSHSAEWARGPPAPQ